MLTYLLGAPHVEPLKCSGAYGALRLVDHYTECCYGLKLTKVSTMFYRSILDREALVEMKWDLPAGR